MTITALHIPCDAPLASVSVNEKNAVSYYSYVQGGPVEAAPMTIGDLDLMLYVNSRYAGFNDDLVNERATLLFDMAGVGMAGGAVKGDALLVRAPGRGSYERSLPPEILAGFLGPDV